jgi:DNA gyrase subunit A
MKVNEISVIGRNTQGVRLISLESETEKVTGISRLPEVAEDVEGGAAEALSPDATATPAEDSAEPSESSESPPSDEEGGDGEEEPTP